MAVGIRPGPMSSKHEPTIVVVLPAKKKKEEDEISDRHELESGAINNHQVKSSKSTREKKV
jgi:hypothetical protein